MYLVAIAWAYVVLMMAVAEALSSQGTVLGAVITLLLYGALPLSLVLYIGATPARRRARQRAEAAQPAPLAPDPPRPAGSAQPDGGRHAAGDGTAPVRKEA